MTGMLASISMLSEAKIVMDAKVDIIDIKDPANGALGALGVDEVKRIVKYVERKIPVSATIGDIYLDDDNLYKYILDMADTGVDYVKVGVFSRNIIPYSFLTKLSSLAKNINIILVLFAENKLDIIDIQSLLGHGIKGIMLDTKNKKNGGLCSKLSIYKLSAFLNKVKKHNLLTGLAGSLSIDDIVPLLSLKPDYLGFRGALCARDNRVNGLDIKRLEQVRAKIPSTHFNFS